MKSAALGSIGKPEESLAFPFTNHTDIDSGYTFQDLSKTV